MTTGDIATTCLYIATDMRAFLAERTDLPGDLLRGIAATAGMLEDVSAELHEHRE